MEAVIENGFAKVGAGDWLMGRAQPVACGGRAVVGGLKGLFVPDRGYVRAVTLDAEAYCASADAPFLSRLDALPDVPLMLTSEKLLAAPRAARTGARSVRLVPMSLSKSLVVTEFRKGWAVAATRSRVTRVALEDGATLTVRPEAVVGWIGNDPSGFCPRLSVFDMILPRMPRNLAFTFHGPATVWFEGSSPDGFAPRRRRERRMR